MPDNIFDSLRTNLPQFEHISVDYNRTDSSGSMIRTIETVLRSLRSNEQVGNKRPLVIAGWSFGGLLALKYAAQGLADLLILFSATASFTRPKEERELGWPEVYVRSMITGLGKDRTSVETRFRRLLFTDAEWEQHKGNCIPSSGNWTNEALISGLNTLIVEQSLSVLSDIKCPTLIIHGTEDYICPYPAAVELHTLLSQSELITLSQCGHVPFIGREEQLANEIRRWWDEKQS
ncbi:alpha/beta hydrolase [Paenibacillus sp. GSMTC-2017]|nr:alpha/beta hydrolase [Paenibacillus sp. GSMTC-2017]MBH5316420.1 alpha/beta hydrolase [Paenibacillus sp. GSMTC-2017]